MTNVKFTPVRDLKVGDVIATGAGTRQTIVEIKITGIRWRAENLVTKITFEDFAGYQSFGFYRSDEEMMVDG